jgi:outer membrane lipoprotein
MRIALILLILLFLLGCLGQPSRQADSSLSVARAIVHTKSHIGQQVKWGGTVIATTNLKYRTMLEILAYPLRNGKPDTSAQSGGRFLAEVSGFREPADYRPGRSVVVEGVFSGVKNSFIGDASTTYAVVQANSVNLVSSDNGIYWPANLHIGVGVFKHL